MQNNITLYEHDLNNYENFNLENNLGTEYAFIRQYNKAAPHFVKAYELHHSATFAYNAGLAYFNMGDMNNSRKYFNEFLNNYHNAENKTLINISNDELLINSSWRLLQKDSPENSKEYIKRALEYGSDIPSLWMYLAISEYQLKNQEGALEAAGKAKALLPNQQTYSLYNLILNEQPLNLSSDNQPKDLSPSVSK